MLNNIFPLNNVLVNKYDSVMSNGSGLYGGGWYHDRIIIPKPSNDSLLYIFQQVLPLVDLMDYIFPPQTTKPITTAEL
ncbi:MAG: hypothetical protein IPJ86_06305 [Bacteroidetes bacterium]|nr:hypothetical protein [Bacteroidota bacterium]